MRKLDIPYYLELQRRLEEIILYISCHEDNFNTYSIKIENLFVDTCSFFDSLCQTFINEKHASNHIFANQPLVKDFSNKLIGREFFNMGDYKILLSTEFGLAEKELNLNIYEDVYYGNPIAIFGPQTTLLGYKIRPFSNWNLSVLDWWASYTKLKHNRIENIKVATFEMILKSLGAVYIILSLKNELDFKNGDISIELYNIFFPEYWEFKGRKMPGIVMWQ